MQYYIQHFKLGISTQNLFSLPWYLKGARPVVRTISINRTIFGNITYILTYIIYIFTRFYWYRKRNRTHTCASIGFVLQKTRWQCLVTIIDQIDYIKNYLFWSHNKSKLTSFRHFFLTLPSIGRALEKPKNCTNFGYPCHFF
jgi:hypothetical protein